MINTADRASVDVDTQDPFQALRLKFIAAQSSLGVDSSGSSPVAMLTSPLPARRVSPARNVWLASANTP
jgi:hypothetical protein